MHSFSHWNFGKSRHVGAAIAAAALLAFAPASIARKAMPMSHQANPGEVWKQAQKLLKDGRRYGIVLEFPSNVQDNQALAMLLRSDDNSLKELLGMVVIVCLRRDFLNKTFKELKAAENALLVDWTGKKLAGAKLDYAQAATPKAFAKALRDLLYGNGGAHLEAWAGAARKQLGADKLKKVEQALKDLDAEHYKQRKAAKKVLKAKLPAALPLLIQARRAAKSVEVRENCRELLIAYADASAAKALGAPQPSPYYHLRLRGGPQMFDW